MGMAFPGGVGGGQPKSQIREIHKKTETTDSIRKSEGQFGGQRSITWHESASNTFNKWYANLSSLTDFLSSFLTPSAKQQTQDPNIPNASDDPDLQRLPDSMGSESNMIIRGKVIEGKEVSKMSDIEKIVYVLPYQLGLDNNTIMHIQNIIDKDAKDNSELLAFGKLVFNYIKDNEKITIDDAFLKQLTENIDTAFKNNPDLQRDLKQEMNSILTAP